MSFNQKLPKDNYKITATTEKSDNNSSTSRSIVEKRTVQLLENKDSIPFRQIDKNERITNENTRNIYYQTITTRQTVTTSNPNFLTEFMQNCNLEAKTMTISHLTGENRETNVTYYPKPNNGAIPKSKTIFESDPLKTKYLSNVTTRNDDLIDNFSKNKSYRNFSNNSVDKPIKNNYVSPIINRHKPITLSNIKSTNNQLRSNFFNAARPYVSTSANQPRNNISNTEFDASKNEASKQLPVFTSKLSANPFPSKPIKTNYVSPIRNRSGSLTSSSLKPENNQLRTNYFASQPSVPTPSSYQINLNKFENTKVLPKLNPGKFYIFHHYEFQNSSDNRDGSKADAELLKNTFKQFKINADEYNNLTVKKIRDKVEKISKQNFSQNSAVIIAILSHGGGMDMIHAYDDKYSIHDDVLLPILSNKTLIGKPKILIVQACKGQIDLRDYDTDSSPRSTKFLTPDEIFKFYSTSEGFVSLRDKKTGSIFIKAFCAEVSKSGHSKCIRSIMDDVTTIVKEITNGKQIPSMCVNNTAPYILGKYL